MKIKIKIENCLKQNAKFFAQADLLRKNFQSIDIEKKMFTENIINHFLIQEFI